MCDRVETYPTDRRVLILQHPQEQDALLGSAQIVVASLPKAKLVVGLSWRNLAHALGEEGVDPRRWAVLFPDREGPGDQVASRRGDAIEPAALEGVVVLDGTWSKAKTLWWRNALDGCRGGRAPRGSLRESASGPARLRLSGSAAQARGYLPERGARGAQRGIRVEGLCPL